MAEFNKQELLKIAHLSALKLEEREMEPFVQHINAILTYVDQLKNIPLTSQAQQIRNVNIFREDIAIKPDSAAILAQAPAVDETFFAVPKILDEK